LSAYLIPCLSPIEAAQLLFGKVTTQVALLDLASQGKVRLAHPYVDDYTATLIKTSDDPVDSVLSSTFIPETDYSADNLAQILCRKNVSKAAEDELRELGSISGNC
jgi:hypothetical protein